MSVVPQEAINQLEALIEEVDESLKRTFKNIHQEGHPHETLMRFLKAREGNVTKALKMLVDCLKWRVENNIDGMLAIRTETDLEILPYDLNEQVDLHLLATQSFDHLSNLILKPIVPVELYRDIRDSQLIGLSGYSNEGLPVFAIGVGMSTLDRASVHYYIQSHIQMNEYRDRVILPAATKKYGRHISKCIKVLDMTGLKLSALNQIKLMTTISSIDDLNYPEKTLTYYIVNAPYVFSACWKVVKPLLQERTRRKINVLSGCGQEELLKVMDYSSLPHFCRKRSSGSSKHLEKNDDSCFSLDHPFHQQLYDYIKKQSLDRVPVVPVKQGSVHVTLPEDANEGDIAKILESELQNLRV